MSTFLERLTAIVDDYGREVPPGVTPADYMPSERARLERATGMSTADMHTLARRVGIWVAEEAAAHGGVVRVSDIAGLWALGVVAGAEASFDG